MGGWRGCGSGSGASVGGSRGCEGGSGVGCPPSDLTPDRLSGSPTKKNMSQESGWNNFNCSLSTFPENPDIMTSENMV